jgi:uncharacterized protein (DUF2164 family)
MAIKLSQDATQRLQASIKRYVEENLDQDIGDLKAGLFLDFCVKEIGPTIYNQAIADAQAYVQGRLDDLEGVCHEKEFSFWPSQKPPTSTSRR